LAILIRFLEKLVVAYFFGATLYSATKVEEGWLKLGA